MDRGEAQTGSRPVFSLWPAEVQSGAGDRIMPAWANGRADERRRFDLARAEAAAVATAVCGLGGGLAWLIGLPAVVVVGATVSTAFFGLLTLVVSMTTRGAARSEAAWRDALFERNGISLWREDWSAVGQAILALKQAGVHDIAAHFAAHPDEARALRSRVRIKDVNSFTVDMMGARSKADFIGPLDRILPDSDQTFGQWLVAFGRGDAFYRSETHIVRPDGSHLDCLFTAALPTTLEGFRDILVTCLDVTDYKTLQAKLVLAETDAARASRISTMGALTASIAHEVNTPLASILANAEASLRWLRRARPELGEAEQAIERAIEDATRTHEVVVRTRAFLSATPHEVEAVDLVETARIALVLIDRELRLHRAAAHLDAEFGVAPVLADPIQMQQVLVNLMINGLQAMAASPAPRDLRVTIRGGDGEVQVSVADKGTGIDEATRGALFDAFVSNRPGGMGMGLAICRNVVEGQGGRIWAENNADGGATFSFALPTATA